MRTRQLGVPLYGGLEKRHTAHDLLRLRCLGGPTDAGAHHEVRDHHTDDPPAS